MIEIRKPSAEDAEAIYMMYDAIVDDTEGRTEASPKWTKGVYPGLEYINGAIERGEMFAAFDDGIVAGAVIRNGRMAPGYEDVEWSVEAGADEVFVIHTLGVSPHHQHRGIASLLTERVARDALESGRKAVRLDVIDGNYPSVKLFEKLGFINHGQHILRYDGMDGVPFTLMELPIVR